MNPVSGETIGVMDTGFHAVDEDIEIHQLVHALTNFLHNNANAIRAARQLRVLTPGQSQLVRMADRFEDLILRAMGFP